MTTRRKQIEANADVFYDSVIEKELHESEELTKFISTLTKGAFYDAVLLRCACFVAILAGLLGGGNISGGKVEEIEEQNLMMWTSQQGMIAGKALLLMTRKRKSGEAAVNAWKR